ncbi:MAG: hypothetical protein R2757_10640 [Draconibacterium sp.]|jgi:hypothetical protein
MIGRFFHTPSAKRFHIAPRFYDPDQEARDERERRIKEELGIVDEEKDLNKPYKPNIKGQFRKADDWQAKSSEAARRAQNRRLIFLILTLVLIFYLFFYSDILF